jgi:hypothetical protein
VQEQQVILLLFIPAQLLTSVEMDAMYLIGMPPDVP